MSHTRVATLDDVDAVVALVHVAYRGEASRAGWTTEADWIDGGRTDASEVAAIVAGPDSLILLVEACPPRLGGDAGAPALMGCCQLAREPEGVAYFGMFAVRPDAQGQGVGKALLADAERFAARTWGAATMRMTVIDVRSELIDWYQRRGYRPTGETEPFPYGNPTSGAPRVPDLRFAVLAKPLPPSDAAF